MTSPGRLMPPPTGTWLQWLAAAQAHLLPAWRSLRWRELGWFMCFGGAIAGMNALSLADSPLLKHSPSLLASESILPFVCALVLMLAWLPADRSEAHHARRPWRLAAATTIASVLVAIGLPPLQEALGWPTVMDTAYALKGVPPAGYLASTLAGSLSMLIPSGLMVAVVEMASRRRRAEEVLLGAQRDHAALQRSTLESRLAAMQAQVEPQFLFDVLVDIERLYGQTGPAGMDDPADTGADEQMDRLITYLRVALPRLRESGSTLGAEVDLLASYLDLVQAMHAAKPRFVADLPAALREVTFHPMLLLPLVQRAVRRSGPPPDTITLQAEQLPKGLRLTLDLAAPELCRDDLELQHLNDRLLVLYGGRAHLKCEARPAEPAGAGRPAHTRFTLDLPA